MADHAHISRWLKRIIQACALRLLLWLGVILSLLRPTTSPYTRDFPKDIKCPRAADIDPYLTPCEFSDPDEADLITQLAASFAQDTTALPKGLGRTDPDFQDPHWGGTTGLLEAELDVTAIDALPPAFRVGLFGANGRYRAVCRPNFLYDNSPKIAISRFSLKLEYPTDVPNEYTDTGLARELDLLLSEGLPKARSEDQDGQGFFFRDGRQLLMANHMKAGFGASARVLLNRASGQVFKTWSRIFATNTDSLYTPQNLSTGWAGKHYYSAGPYALGPGAMKFCLIPLQSHAFEPCDIEVENPSLKHRTRLQAGIKAGQGAQFSLAIQLATEASIRTPQGSNHPPKAVMAAEYTDLVWDEDAAPFVVVATLRVFAKEAFEADEPAPWYGAALTGAQSHALRFNAWNTLPQMRPLGQLFRARRHVHKTHRDVRLAHSFGPPPNA